MSILGHLWQSTLCAVVAALLAILLRRSPARTRHAIWLAASVKFLVPLSLFVALGRSLGQQISASAYPQAGAAIRWIDRSLGFGILDAASGATASPLVSGVEWLAVLWICGIAAVTVWRWREWSALAAIARFAPRLERGREADAFGRVAHTASVARIDLRQSPAGLEPGVLGLFRPVLLWPAGLSEQLTDPQLDAVMAHELSHVRRKDNLSAAIHMAVEALFWFHPLVWWIGARMIAERERACDEEVVHMGIDSRRYAESIVRVCSFCLRAPSAQMAGVGGSGLAARVERILGTQAAHVTTVRARLLLAGVLAAAATTPMAVGASVPHASAAARQDVHRPGKGIQMPKLVYSVNARYTAEAIQARIQGSVKLDAVVLATGDVGEVTVLESLDAELGLDDEAVKAVKQWRFEPGTKGGEPVAVRIEIEMVFRLK